MYLTYRLMQPADLETCFPFAQARYPYVKDSKKDILAFWRELLTTGCIHLVIQDRDQPRNRRNIGFAIAFFAMDCFIREAHSTLPPFISQGIFERWRKGRKLFLPRPDIPKAESGEGLNVVKLNWGFDRERYDPEGQTKIHRFLSESYQVLLAGHRLKEYLEEVYGTEEMERFLGLGLDVQRDYGEFVGTQYLPARDEKSHPYLMGAIFAELRKNKRKMETPAGKLAHLGPPRFTFKPNEQEVLKRALNGETDREIAGAIGLTLDAVKKRWQGIYEKVEAMDPHFFSGPGDVGNGGKGRQKRRMLLRILREHPEELWPNPA